MRTGSSAEGMLQKLHVVMKEDTMRIPVKAVCHAVCLSAMLFCFSCTPGISLRVQEVRDTDVTGTYTTIFYGCTYSDDLESVAFLDRDGDRYTMAPYAPDFRYRVIKGMDAKEAFSKAEGFLHCNTAFQGSQLREIIAPGGERVGYEIRPVYYAFVYGAGDPISVDYWLKGDTVVIQIRLTPWAERFLFGGSSAVDE
jgi:hypothetical protein